jgi:hypothetical protein
MVKKEIGFMKKAGAPKSMIKHEKSEMGMKSGGMHKMPDGKMMKNSAMKMASGGMPMVMKDGKKVPSFAADGQGKMKHGGMTKMGSVKTNSKPDGVAVKGKTQGTMIKMKSGGRAC